MDPLSIVGEEVAVSDNLFQTSYGNDAIPFIILGGLIALGILWTLGILAIGFVKAIRGNDKKSSVMNAEEAKAFQELERGFRRMEERVESLETLIIDRSRKETYDRELHR